MFRIVIITFFLMMLPFFGASQDFFYKTFDVNDGLPSTTLYRCVEDNKGFMWILTSNGVSKFDGSNFRNFTTKDGLPKNNIWNVEIDYKNRIWLGGYYKGLYYIENDTVKFIKNSKKISDKGVILFAKQENDTCYFYERMTEGSCFYLDPKKNELIKTSQFANINLNNHRCSYVVSCKENFNNLLVSYKPSQLNNYSFFPKMDSLVYIYNNNKKVVQVADYFGLEADKVYYINPTNKLVLVINDSVHVYNSFFNLKRDELLENKLNKIKRVINSFKWIYEDSEKNLWITSETDKLYFIPFNNHYILRLNLNEKLLSGSIDYLAQNSKYLYIFLKNNTILEYNKETKSESNFFSTNLILDPIRDIKTNNDGDILINRSTLIQKISSESNKIINYSNSHNESYRFAFDFINDSVFYTGNLSKFLIKNNNTIELLENRKIDDRISVFIKSDTTFFLSGIEGCYFYNRMTNKIIKYPWVNIISGIKIENGFVLGSADYGIIHVDFNGNVLDSLHVGHSINDLFIDNKFIYAATNSGLFIDQIKNNSIVKYKKIGFAEGLSSNEVLKVCADSNSIYISTSRDVNIINKSILTSINSPPPRIYLDRVLVNYSKINFIDQHTFNSYQNTFQFDFKALSYHSLGKIEFKYMMEGVDDFWIYTKQESIRYPNLEPGDYKFKIVALNASKKESKPITYFFTIKPHFTNTLLFRIIIIFCLLGFVFGITYYFQKRKQNKISVKKEYAELELKALRAQMNPHFIFNSLNAIQSVMFTKGERKANEYIGAFSSLIRKTLDNSKTELHPLKNELEYISLYLQLEKWRLNDNLNYSIYLDDRIESDDFLINNMIIQPLVENAIIHGLAPLQGERKLAIRVELHGKYILVTIEDNGIGRLASSKSSRNKNHTSWSTSIINDRLSIINNKNEDKIILEIEDLIKDNIPSGTKVSLKFPYKYEQD
jgi:Histidine kinase/Y_Y_Y domain